MGTAIAPSFAERNMVMTLNKKRIQNVAGAAVSPEAASKAGPPPPSASASVGRAATFQGTLRHVITLAHAVSLEQKPSPDQKASVIALVAADVLAAPGRAEKESKAGQLLAQALEELEPEAALKLRTLMVAGRDGRGVTAVHVEMKPADADSASATGDLSESSSLLADYLRRGHAMACAMGLDLEKSLATWPSSVTQTLDERAWLSFGVQLAKSQPEDWTCLGFVGADGAQQLTKLYLRLGEHAWWSFRSVLDRPSTAFVDKEKKAMSKRRSKGVAGASLKTMADRSCGTEGRALRRAVKAIRARVGVVGEPA